MSNIAITEKAANISPKSENLRRVRTQIVENGDFTTDEEIKAAREEKTDDLFTILSNEVIESLDYIMLEEFNAQEKAAEEKFPPHLSAAEVFNIIRAEIVENGEFMTFEEINAEINAVRRGER
ncbi:MAG: hypothetical protein FWG65_04690 [Turicibacter sp.]|nr:hypothetical protein [Turicibacter sp.]